MRPLNSIAKRFYNDASLESKLQAYLDDGYEVKTMCATDNHVFCHLVRYEFVITIQDFEKPAHTEKQQTI